MILRLYTLLHTLFTNLKSVTTTVTSHTSTLSSHTSSISTINGKLTDSGWSSGTVGSGWYRYRKLNGWVFVQFAEIQPSSSSAYRTIFTLPSGYRPAYQITVPMVYMSNENRNGILRVETSGAVQLYGQTYGPYYAGAVSFPV